ncbi:MAG: glycerophosphodiester phosphodiesterase [Promethearchaeia archaeon]
MQESKILICGHRGYKGKEIENTKAAILRAIEEKIDLVEIDVRKTRDGELVLFHDRKINRLLNGKGLLKKYTLKELKSFQYEDGQKILTFDEFLELIKDKIIGLIDIKAGKIERKLIEQINKKQVENQVILQSLFGNILKKCYKIAPNLEYAKYCAYIGKLGNFLGKKLKFHKITAPLFFRLLVKGSPAKYINLDGPFIYDEFIDLLKQKGYKIILGAMKTEKYLKNVFKWKIDIINADNPELVKKFLKNYPKC